MYLRSYAFKAYCLALLLLMGCQSNQQDELVNRVETNMKDRYKEFEIGEFSFLIAQNGKIQKQFELNYEKNELEVFGNIVDNFAAPVFLNALIKEGAVNENQELAKMFYAVVNPFLKVNDLIYVSARHFESALQDTYKLISMIKGVVRTSKNRKTYAKLDEFKARELGISGTTANTRNLLESLWRVSDYFDKNNIEYASPGPNIKNLFPTWYTQNLKGFFGWKILKFQKQTILWNCFVNGNETLLVIKFMDKDVFVATCYRSDHFLSPIDRRKEDLLQSPVALAILQAVLFEKSKVIDRAALLSALEKPGNESNWIFIARDVLAYARLYARKGDRKEAERWYKAYFKQLNDTAYAKYIDDAPIAQIDYIADNLDAVQPFELKTDQEVQVFAGGQGIRVKNYDTEPYQYDNIQLMFNLMPNGAEKEAQFQLFQFNYRFDKIAGLKDDKLPDYWLKNTGIKYAFSDPTDTSYVLEVSIPWKELRVMKPVKGSSFATNVFIGDSDIDENVRKSILSWSVERDYGWNDVSRFGQLKLMNVPKANADREINSIKATQPVLIDGIADEAWNVAAASQIKNTYMGSMRAFEKNSSFKTLWDAHNLYLLFDIKDDCKNITGLITKDKCWIEDEQGDLVWKMQADEAKDLLSVSASKRLKLKAGKYTLRYVSDKGHSFEGWYGNPPKNGVYGIQVYHAKH